MEFFTEAIQKEVRSSRLHYSKVVLPNGYVGVVWREFELIRYTDIKMMVDKHTLLSVQDSYQFAVSNRDTGEMFIGDTFVTAELNKRILMEEAEYFGNLRLPRRYGILRDQSAEDVEEALQMLAAMPRRNQNDSVFRI